MNQIEMRAISAPWHDGVEILIKEGNSVGINVTMSTVEPGAVVEPILKISYQEAQTLMDDLWNAGLRPTEGTGSAGALRAVEKHLEDMRKLVFHNKE